MRTIKGGVLGMASRISVLSLLCCVRHSWALAWRDSLKPHKRANPSYRCCIVLGSNFISRDWFMRLLANVLRRRSRFRSG